MGKIGECWICSERPAIWQNAMYVRTTLPPTATLAECRATEMLTSLLAVPVIQENINVREDELDTLQLVSKQNIVCIKFNTQLSYEKHLHLHTRTPTIQLMNGATTTVNITAGQEQTCFLCGSASHIRLYCPGKGSRQIGNNNNRPFLISDLLKPIRDLPDENHPSTVLPMSEEATTSASSRTIEPNTREDGQGGQDFTREDGTSTETTTRPTILLGHDPIQDDIENNLVEMEDSDTITADEDETKEPGKKRRKKSPELDQVKNDGQSTNIEKNKILGNSSQLDSHIKDGNQVKLTNGSSNQSNAITSIQESRTRMEGDNWSDEIEMEGKTMESEVDMIDSRAETHGSKILTKVITKQHVHPHKSDESNNETVRHTNLDNFFGPAPYRISEMENENLEQNISKEEIYAALLQGKKSKTPGSDGIPQEFYLKFWDLIGTDFTEVLNVIITRQRLRTLSGKKNGPADNF
ncbi:hypothetical protein ANN_08025 [Periplaneta americana]|uniref:Uncharacterized protein n=1 Tax=Periplaneta americana TaxID=6978 RepID=A0ABQ8T1I0_PERAM|nr:hypothetical protein ANN_08025 [Periplaneta americana]